MLKPLSIIALAIGVTLPTLSPAQSLVRRERFDIPVFAIDNTTFEVIENDGAGGTQLWCAAGIYAREVLGQRGGSLYIKEARGPSRSVQGRKGVVFTTQPVEGAFTSYSQGVRRAGQVFSMAHAYALCRGTPRLRINLRQNRL